MKYLDCVINTGLFQYISKSDYISALEQIHITERSYARGETVFYEGDIIDRICILRKGAVRAEKGYPDGEVHIVSVFSENEIFALEIAISQKRTSPVDYIANESSQVLFLSLRSVDHSGFREPIRRALTEQLADENIRMTHKIEILAERGLRDRIMVYLHILVQKSGSSTVSVPMSREQLAQYLCVNRSALSNELNKMKREGIIDFHRHQFTVLEQKKK